MSSQILPRHVCLVHPTLFVWVAALVLVIAPARSVAQSTPQSPLESKPQSTPQSTSQSKLPSAKPEAKSSDVKSSIAATSPKKNIDWWVPGLLGASVIGAGVGMTLIMRRSQPQLATQPPEGLIYTPEPQVYPPSTDPKASPKASSKATKASSKANPKVTSKASPKAESPIAPIAPQPDSAPSNPISAAPTAAAPQTPAPLPPPRSEAIATQTVRMAKPSVMDALVHHLRSGDPTQRQKAIWELGQRGDSRAVQPLVDLLLDSDSQQRGLVLSALTEISTRTLKPVSRALAISLQDENADVRKNAIRDLTRVYDLLTNVSQLLQSACEDPDLDVQETAKWALGQINRIKAPLIEPGPRLSISRPEIL